ncbi:hypothetical protein GW17_00053271 [Ensete ventricosum]|nr:hypothetical protein GW17_00053271 [Ensete ventricosum]
MTWGSSKDTFAASLCIRPTATLRRSMTEVVELLEGGEITQEQWKMLEEEEEKKKRFGGSMTLTTMITDANRGPARPSISVIRRLKNANLFRFTSGPHRGCANGRGRYRFVGIRRSALTCARASRQQSNRPSTCGGAPRLLSRRRRPPWRRYLGRRVWADRAVISSASGAASRRLSVLLFLLPFRSEARPSIPPHPLIAPRTETSVLALVCFFSF